MVPGLTVADYAVLGIFLAAMLALGALFHFGAAGRREATTADFFLAGRSLTCWPLGLSLGVAGYLAAHYCCSPNEAYWVGLRLLLVPALVWASMPIVFWCIIPLNGTLQLDSIFEYIELRYSPTTRAAAALVYVVGQVLWLGGVLVLPCVALRLGTGLDKSVLVLLVAVGGVATLYTFLGGMRATVFTDVVQIVLMVVALVVLIGSVATSLKPGAGLSSIWEVAGNLGRTSFVEPTHGWSPQWSAMAAEWSVWSAGWSIWAVVPYLAILPMFFFVADQATLQRLLAARDDQDMILSYLIGCGLFSMIAAAAMFVGLGLLAVYHDNAQAMIRPNWVVNSARDPETGEPLIGPDTVINAETIEGLLAGGAILDPNTDRPLTDSRGLIDSQGHVRIDRLATRAVRRRGGELYLRTGGDELFGNFVKRHLPVVGLAGVVLAALAAAAMATIDSALNALATVVVVDFHRRFGWAELWLARKRGKDPDELDQTDEVWLGRRMVLLFGGAVIVVSLVVAELGGALSFLLGVMNLLAGPLLGIFLLGLFTRRTTAPAALGAMILGMLTTLGATFGHRLAALPTLASVWPFEGPLGPFWPLSIGLAGTLVAGYVLSFLIGSRKSRDALSGLVFGLGRWGVLLEVDEEREEEVYWIEIDEESPPGQGPWR